MMTTVLIQASLMSSPKWFSPSSILVFEAAFSVLSSFIVDWVLNLLRGKGKYAGPHVRNFVGFLILGLTYAFYSCLQFYMNQNSVKVNGVFESSVSIWWQVPGQFLFALGSTLVFSACPEYAAVLTPSYMKAAVLSIFNISSAFADIISITRSPVVNADLMLYSFMSFAALSFAIAIPYFYQYRHYNAIHEKRINCVSQES